MQNIKIKVHWHQERPDDKDENGGLLFGIYTMDCTKEDYDEEAGYGSYDILDAEWFATEEERDRVLMLEVLEAEIVADALKGDTTVLAELLSKISDSLIYASLSDEGQKEFNKPNELEADSVGKLIELLSFPYSKDARITDEQNQPFTHITNLNDGSVVLSTVKPIGVCNRSGGNVYPSKVHGYSGFCPELDEDLYSFEFTRNEDAVLDSNDTIVLEEDQHIFVEANNISICIKHNDVGISVDYYLNEDEVEEPFRADQVWWDDAE